MMNGFWSGSAAVLGAAALLLVDASPAQAATELTAIARNGASEALLLTFDAATGLQTGGVYLDDGLGQTFAFNALGSLFYAPDGSLQALGRSGGGMTALLTFDPTTGKQTGGLYLNDGLNDLAFDQMGSAFYAPDGSLQALGRTGGGLTTLLTFDTTTGQQTNGVYLNDGLHDLAFDQMGSAFYAPDGSLQALGRSGGGLTTLLTFDAATGQQTNGLYLNDGLYDFAFDWMGSAFYGSDGSLRAISRNGGGLATLLTFDAATGLQTGGLYLNDGLYDLEFVALGSAAPAPSDVSSAVPEPGTWALMIAGFGAMGTALRRRRLGLSARRLA